MKKKLKLLWERASFGGGMLCLRKAHCPIFLSRWRAYRGNYWILYVFGIRVFQKVWDD